MGSGDDQAFKVNFSGEGVAKLREKVQEKLMEFMGDYSDDTLVEYVMVLLRNGRNKGEAKNELDVFLGDDSESFVSWLWDHLGSNLNLYVQQQKAPPDRVTQTRPLSVEHAGKNEMHHVKYGSDQVKPDVTRPRHKREWKGLLRDTEEHQAIVVDTTCPEVGNQPKLSSTVHSASPELETQRKRGRSEDASTKKRESTSQANIAAPRRLLQFAVRDALATSRQSNLVAEPSLKRLRSVVSTSMGESTEDHPLRLRSVARLANPEATTIRTIVEAAKDIKKVRSSSNVFDRLGSVPNTFGTRDQLELMDDVSEDEKFVDVAEVPSTYHHQRSDYSEQYAAKLQSDTWMDPIHDDTSFMGLRAVDASQRRSYAGINSESPLLVEHIAGDSSDGIVQKSLVDQDQPTPTHYASRTLPLNTNTWKSPKYQEARNALETGYSKSTHSSEMMGTKPITPLVNENSDPVAVNNGNAKSSADTEAASQKILSVVPGLYPTGTHTEDSDSRTIFVNNVHFAATKDSLSRHFNKFGDVLKVIILTDAGTGQPKGSAYIEFMRKESVEHALSLDGTSFMSRLLKVVRKSSAPPEVSAAPSMPSWPRVLRGAPYNFGRSPFPFRGAIQSPYRSPSPALKPGARSMQWKRGAQSTPNQSAPASGSPSFAPRSMTYVRTEQRTNGTSDAAV
ncbi:unnamed protein product [Cuscuta campestris]|uniref:RRM domain-containing protein n=1 Tax=Cuscuta campestris TaxID=132261 RepID=A0A484LHH1_9ASTE|nr:unnamed protein product [Cuscuta campestris]